MTLKENSRSAKLYRWFFMKDKMPGNLCPYFWQLLLMYITIIPYTIWGGIYFISQSRKKYEMADNFSDRFVFSSIFNFLIFLAFCMIVSVSSLFINYEKHSLIEGLSYVGDIVWALTIFCLILSCLISTYEKFFKKKITDEVEEDSVITEFVKAKYNKYCPKIDWQK
jgi:magnesium-transporting ATPase (P-type)